METTKITSTAKDARWVSKYVRDKVRGTGMFSPLAIERRKRKAERRAHAKAELAKYNAVMAARRNS